MPDLLKITYRNGQSPPVTRVDLYEPEKGTSIRDIADYVGRKAGRQADEVVVQPKSDMTQDEVDDLLDLTRDTGIPRRVIVNNSDGTKIDKSVGPGEGGGGHRRSRPTATTMAAAQQWMRWRTVRGGARWRVWLRWWRRFVPFLPPNGGPLPEMPEFPFPFPIPVFP